MTSDPSGPVRSSDGLPGGPRRGQHVCGRADGDEHGAGASGVHQVPGESQHFRQMQIISVKLLMTE